MAFEFKPEHKKNLPTVRIQKIILDNFKSVKHGEVVFHCGKHFVPYDTKSDILGVYGQNGSGKTSLIEALGILESAMSGMKIPDPYSECISKWADHSRLSFTFDFQYPDGKIRKIVYAFSITAIKNGDVERTITYDEQTFRNPYKNRVSIFDEVILMGGDFSDHKKPLKPIIDTSSITEVFEPKAKQKVFVDADEVIEDLKYQKRLDREKSLSFVFASGTIQSFFDSGFYSEYFQVLLELRYFAKNYLFVVNTRSIGFIRAGFTLPLFTRQGAFLLDTMEPQILPKDVASCVYTHIERINTVLEQLIPHLSVSIQEISDAVTKDGESGKLVELIAKRENLIMPFRYESDGVKKIVSVLSLIVSVFNERSITVAIDEIDAGIYEYLLGELLQMVQDSGKGQLVFTSHNLRPLEVLNKEFICFTTTNPDNRYYRIKGVGATNNLRNTYIREILMNDQDEELYKGTKKYKVLDSLIKAGALLNPISAPIVMAEAIAEKKKDKG